MCLSSELLIVNRIFYEKIKTFLNAPLFSFVVRGLKKART